MPSFKPLRDALFGAAAVALALGAACSKREEPSESNCPITSVLSYENFGGAFFLSYCKGCHTSGLVERQGAPGDINFDSLADIVRRSERVRARTLVEPGPNARPMPPAGGPRSAEKRDLDEWLSCGAPGDDRGQITGSSSVTTTSTGGGLNCADSNSCDVCTACAVQSSCAMKVSDCQSDAECLALQGCMGGCNNQPPAAQAACRQDCTKQYPNSVQTFSALVNCLLCGDCRMLCGFPCN